MTKKAVSILISVGALALAGVAAVAAVAPQVPTLLLEGFPDPVWPASGSFAEVAGVDEPERPATPRALNPEGQQLFDLSGGRAFIADVGGERLAETYALGLDRETRLNSYSLAKSLVGALAVKAVSDGRIKSLDISLSDLIGPQAPDVSLRSALTMTSGLTMAGEPPKEDVEKSLDDGAFSPFGPLARLHVYGLDSTLNDIHVDRSRVGEFSYQSANTALVASVVEKAYGKSIATVLSELIWKPSGAATAFWRRYPEGNGISAYCCLYARPVDWVRVGRFLLKNGRDDKPFLREAYWRDLIQPDISAEARHGGVYGLHIRHDVLDRPGQAVQAPFSYMLGQGGQVVYLLPDQDAVVVRFGEKLQLLHSTLYALLGGTNARKPGGSAIGNGS